MRERHNLVGHRLAVLASSRHDIAFLPLSDVSFFSLFPDIVSSPKNLNVQYRLAEIDVKYSHDDGKLHSRCIEWWGIHSLYEKNKKFLNGLSHIIAILNKLQAVINEAHVSDFGPDLPIFVDSNLSCARALDWEALEYDVYRGLNGKIPFNYQLSEKVAASIADELPFLDLVDHFRTKVPDSVIISLIRQLLEQYTKQVKGMTLIPVRWIKTLDSKDVIVVETDVPVVFNLSDPSRAEVKIGALDVSLRRAGTIGRFRPAARKKY